MEPSSDIITQLQAEDAAMSGQVPVVQEVKMGVQAVVHEAPKVMDIKPVATEHAQMPQSVINEINKPTERVTETTQEPQTRQDIESPVVVVAPKKPPKKPRKPLFKTNLPIVPIIIAILIAGVLGTAIYMIQKKGGVAVGGRAVGVRVESTDVNIVKPIEASEIDAVTKSVDEAITTDTQSKEFDSEQLSDTALGL